MRVREVARRGTAAAAAFVVCTAAVSACARAENESPATAADSRRRDEGAADTMPLPPDALDSLTGLGAVVPPRDTSPGPKPAPALPPPPPAPADTGNVVASAADLGVLRAELAMPVPGVRPDELHDTFNEARGGGQRLHHALDIPAPRGTPVLSAAAGRVLKLYTSQAGGLMVYAADSSERFVLMYAHLDAYAPGLHDGMPLARGQTIGTVGTTGNAPPNVPHLHFAVARSSGVARWWAGTPVDPRPLLQP